MAELESVRIGMCWNTQVSQSQSDVIGKCQNMKVSEYTPRLHVQILTSPAAFQTNGRTSCQPVTEPAAAT